MAICQGCGNAYYPSEGEGHEDYCDDCTQNCDRCGIEMTPIDYDCGDGLCSFCNFQDDDQGDDS